MKVGTDGVLLGAWVSVRPSDRRILDIGSGTGLIALMMAQRVPGARITGVDVEDISQCPVQEFAPQGKFDLVVSNPPFFVDSLTCPDAGRTTARHAVRLPFGDLRDAVVRLLSDEGRFAVVLPADEAARFIGICRDVLLPVRRTDVRTTPRHAAKRVLLEFVHTSSAPAPDRTELVIGTGVHEQYTPEYRALTRDFYLKF